MVISYVERIVKHLQQTRPNLSVSSLKTYSSVLYNLHKKCIGQWKISIALAQILRIY